VLARFQEDPSFVHELLDAGIDVRIVNRGPAPLSLERLANASDRSSAIEWSSRPNGRGRFTLEHDFSNVGREGHVYLRHMISHLNSSSHGTRVYCQSNSNNTSYKETEFIDDVKRLCARSRDEQPAGPALNANHQLVLASFRTLSFAYLCNRNRYFHVGYPYGKVFISRRLIPPWTGALPPDQLRDFLTRGLFCPCACFIVDTNLIRAAYERDPNAFWYWVRLLGSSDAPFGIYALERFWMHLLVGRDLNAVDEAALYSQASKRPAKPVSVGANAGGGGAAPVLGDLAPQTQSVP
jgi:hypothetical protein